MNNMSEPSRQSTDRHESSSRRSTDRRDLKSSSISKPPKSEKTKKGFDLIEKSRRSVDCIQMSRKNNEHIDRARKSVDRLDRIWAGQQEDGRREELLGRRLPFQSYRFVVYFNFIYKSLCLCVIVKFTSKIGVVCWQLPLSCWLSRGQNNSFKGFFCSCLPSFNLPVSGDVVMLVELWLCKSLTCSYENRK